MNICVFCSSSNALNNDYFTAAEQLGELMTKNNHNLIYGGSNVGLMDKLANVIKKNNGHVTGVIPEVIKNKGLAYQFADKLIITSDLSERKKKMIELADAFVALPGGFGTLEEIIEVLTLKQLQIHNKPIAFLNTNNFYDKLFEFFEVIYKDLFAKNEYRDYYTLCSTPLQIIEYIDKYKVPEFKDKWFNVNPDEFRK